MEILEILFLMSGDSGDSFLDVGDWTLLTAYPVVAAAAPPLCKIIEKVLENRGAPSLCQGAGRLRSYLAALGISGGTRDCVGFL